MTPLERAAQAIRDTYPLPIGEDPLASDESKDVARAVLTAIRDFPNFNDPVTKAGSAVLSVGAAPHWSRDHEAQKVWAAMIDAALAET